ncbi:MAG TPA: VOC family protein [Lacipirellulaceae bacterium]|nr:VOC family protein [Lacipirellulaceae bacterium]
MPKVSGILETALYVKDVAASAAFYRRLFGFRVLLESDRLIALNVAGKDVLLIFSEGTTKASFATPGGVIPGHNGAGPTHFALSISSDDVDPWRKRLASQAIPIESEVEWEGGAHSIYFRDPDGTLVELITPGFWQMA